MIDLHLHTTASDGYYSPEQLVDRAFLAGLKVISITDHDTVAATEPIKQLAEARGLLAISGTEITAVDHNQDIHMLGYFLDHQDEALEDFLADQREYRITRIKMIADRLSELDLPIDISNLLEKAHQPGNSVGRPHIAQAMVRSGHVGDIHEAFDKWLGADCPAFVPRTGPLPTTVIGVIHAAGGIVSLAHPGLTSIDENIKELQQAGLDAIEVYHARHSVEDRDRYLAIARTLGLFVTGGSDYHGNEHHRGRLGKMCLPEVEWNRIKQHLN